MDGTSNPAGAAAAQWLTATNLTLIAIAAVVVLVAIAWGSRAAARRRAAEREIATQASAHDAPAVEPVAPPPPPPAPASGNDDFTRMKGVGPKLAARLRELGVTSYRQIAELTPADADALDARLGAFKGRMSRDRWIEQAAYLARDDRAGFEAAFGKL